MNYEYVNMKIYEYDKMNINVNMKIIILNILFKLVDVCC